MKILALSGSLRRNSYNTAIVKTLQKLNKDVEVYTSLEQLALFNPDLDNHTLDEKGTIIDEELMVQLRILLSKMRKNV